MLKTILSTAAAVALTLGATSNVHASKDDSGDYKGGALYGPLPGQVFGHGWRRGRPFGIARGGRTYGYVYTPRAYHRAAR